LLKLSYTDNSGFTLIELVVVIAILAVLMTMIVPKVTQALNKAKKQTDEANRHIIRNALERYYIDEGNYPDNLEELAEKKYIEKIEYVDEEGHPYDYKVGADKQSYTLN